MKFRLSMLLALLLAWPAFATVNAGEKSLEGSTAPGFRLQDQSGHWHSLADYRGDWVVLYFYPKDDTPGCTTEACSFRDEIYRYKALGAKVIGVSLDDVDSHREFADKYELPFPLLADVDKTTAQAYGVLRSLGPLDYANRETFIINPQGRIARHYPDVDPDEHTGEVLMDLEALMARKSSENKAGDDKAPG